MQTIFSRKIILSILIDSFPKKRKRKNVIDLVENFSSISVKSNPCASWFNRGPKLLINKKKSRLKKANFNTF